MAGATGTFPGGASCTLAPAGHRQRELLGQLPPGDHRGQPRDQGRLRRQRSARHERRQRLDHRHQALDLDHDRLPGLARPATRRVPCSATVSDTDAGDKAAPTGSVTFTLDPSSVAGATGTFPGGASCTLAPAGHRQRELLGQLPPGDHRGQPRDQGRLRRAAALHETSAGSDSITVTKRSTSTSVSCVPASVVVSQNTTCSATVSDTNSGDKSAPSGNVTFSSTGAGTFSAGTGTFTAPSTCTLAPAGPASSTCSVTYTPSNASSTTHTITGAYQGSAVHKTSSGTFDVAVGKRSTTTSVACSPLLTVINTSSTCTATVTDTEVAGYEIGARWDGHVQLLQRDDDRDDDLELHAVAADCLFELVQRDVLVRRPGGRHGHCGIQRQ